MMRATSPSITVGDVGFREPSVNVIDFSSDAASDGLLGTDVLGRFIIDVDLVHATRSSAGDDPRHRCAGGHRIVIDARHHRVYVTR
jgi:hypothetical protein